MHDLKQFRLLVWLDPIRRLEQVELDALGLVLLFKLACDKIPCGRRLLSQILRHLVVKWEQIYDGRCRHVEIRVHPVASNFSYDSGGSIPAKHTRLVQTFIPCLREPRSLSATLSENVYDQLSDEVSNPWYLKET